jgi:tRNA-2-methylthio-N6-dimethylallyladenosine synthase
VLIDGLSKKNKQEVIGRTDSDKQVVIKAGSARIGDFVNVDIIDAAGVSLFGIIH